MPSAETEHAIRLAKTPLQLAESAFKAGWEGALDHCVDAVERVGGSEPATDGTWTRDDLVKAIADELRSLKY